MGTPACENFWDVIQENSLVFLLNNALVYMFPRIQNETRVHLGQDKGAVLAKKRASKLCFHCEQGCSCPHLPPKSVTAESVKMHLPPT